MLHFFDYIFYNFLFVIFFYLLIAFVVYSGSRDSFILSHDMRMANPTTQRMKAHDEEICGLQWSPDGFLNTLLHNSMI